MSSAPSRDVRSGSLPDVTEFRERTHAERLASLDGYFPPNSVIRRIGNTPLTPFLGGGAAVLLQVAHPLVAAGVVEHSDYRADLWRRLSAPCARCTSSPTARRPRPIVPARRCSEAMRACTA